MTTARTTTRTPEELRELRVPTALYTGESKRRQSEAFLRSRGRYRRRQPDLEPWSRQAAEDRLFGTCRRFA